MLLAFVHGGYSYQLILEGPCHQHVKHFGNAYSLRHYLRTEVNAYTVAEGERLILKEVETNRTTILRSNNYSKPEDGVWQKEGF